MFENNKVRWFLICLTVVGATICLVPNFYSFSSNQWWFSKEKLIYGLDIQGGLHLVMGVKVDEAIREKIKTFIPDLKAVLKSHDIALKDAQVLKDKPGELVLSFALGEDQQQAQAVIEKKYLGSLLGNVPLRIQGGGDTYLTLGYNELELIRLRKNIVAQVVEVIRRRIDEFGVSEPVITAQGEDRVLVQLPGIQDSARAKDIIQKTAKMEFRLVSDKIKTLKLVEWIEKAEKKGNYALGDKYPYREYIRKINEDLKDKLPQYHQLVFQRAVGSNSLRAGKIPVLVRTDSGASGEILQTAFVGMDDFGNPEVRFHINVTGRKLFSELTGQNIGKALAIVLDKELKSMPIIRGHISDRGNITLGRGPNIREEAQNIATVLRAGSLPASMVKLEERTVGPTLGQDSIQKAKLAAGIAGIIVMLFMLVYYQFLGLVANLALGMNILFLLAMLTSLGATLTLPGVAGIILTIGMAVDANVIIYERLKEEFQKGLSLALAVRDGYRYALSAILDANITTAIVCVILMSFGTGPIRGFAVTLFCGILTSLFTAIFVSRTIIHTVVHRFRWKIL